MAVTRALRNQSIGFAAVMFVCYLVLVTQDSPSKLAVSSDTIPPSLFAIDAQVSTFDSVSGDLTWTMNSPKVNYFESTNLVVADTPSLVLYKDSHTQPWFVNAGRAAIYQNQTLVRLNQNVTMRHPNANAPPQTIETSRIDYYPSRHFAEAIYPVEIHQGANSSRGDSLKLWMEREYVEMEGNIESIYESN